jgi:hypothetical protein
VDCVASFGRREKGGLTINSDRTGLANVEFVFAPVAADPVCTLAFVNKIAVAIALSEFRIALRGRSASCGSRCNDEQECQQRRKNDPRKRHCKSPDIYDCAFNVRLPFDGEILDLSPMQQMARRQYDCAIYMSSVALPLEAGAT